MNNKHDTYEVSDLHEAAAILCFNLEIISTTRDSTGRVGFVFELTDEIESLASKFWQGHLMVDAKKYGEAIKQLKNIIYRDKI